MDNEAIIVLAAIPMTVPVAENETELQFLDRWKKVDALTDGKKEILYSEFTIQHIEDVAKRFRLIYEEVCDISRLVRSIVTKELNVSQIDSYLKQKIQHIGQPDRDNVKNVIAEILSQQITQVVEEKKETIEATLAQALAQYPKLGEQTITTDQIKLKYFPTPVRPSIKNWITDFHDALGAMTHSPIDRGNFLFHSENGKKLTPIERQKLGTILKSLDEQSLLTIDPVAQAVVFEGAEHARVIPSSTGNPEQSRNLDSKSSYRPDVDGNDNVGRVQTQRTALPNIDLRQSQLQQRPISHDVFGDLAPISKPEAIQDPQLQKRVEGFFAKAENKNVVNSLPADAAGPEINAQQSWQTGAGVSAPLQSELPANPAVRQTVNAGNVAKASGGIIKNFFSSAVAPTPTSIEAENKKIEEKNDFFQIPQSKPPIGSEHYNENTTSIVAAPNAIEKSYAEKAQFAGGFLPVENQQNRDLMSDEMLFQMIQEKKIKQVSSSQSPVAPAAVSFSSPQKLPAEQGMKAAQTPIVQAKQRPTMRITQTTQPQQPQHSPFRIIPSDFAYGKKEVIPKISGNVVDLKN